MMWQYMVSAYITHIVTCSWDIYTNLKIKQKKIICNMKMDPNANPIGTNELNMDGSERIDMKSGASIIFTAPE